MPTQPLQPQLTHSVVVHIIAPAGFATKCSHVIECSPVDEPNQMRQKTWPDESSHGIRRNHTFLLF